MPVSYNISPHLKLVIYVCSGVVSGEDIFKTSDRVLRDRHRTSGLRTIIDFLSAVENIQLGELQEAIRRIESLVEKGFAVGPLLILSHSTGMQVLVDTINLLPHKVPFKIEMVSTLDAAISELGLLDSREEVIRFWHESKALTDQG
jgi:hypothetical protein